VIVIVELPAVFCPPAVVTFQRGAAAPVIDAGVNEAARWQAARWHRESRCRKIHSTH